MEEQERQLFGHSHYNDSFQIAVRRTTFTLFYFRFFVVLGRTTYLAKRHNACIQQ